MNQLGEYTLIKEINKSPLGTLHLAEHHLLKRRIALKFLSPELRADSEVFTRFEKEIAMLAALEHPNLVRLQNVGLDGECCFLAYDWLSDSQSPCKCLYDYTNASEETLYSFALQIASALDSVHEFYIDDKPVAHLGVKGSNVLIQQKGDSLRAYLADTGLTRLLSPGTFLLLLLKECGQELEKAPGKASNRIWQSFHALAPEQKRGDSSNFEKVDSYAFGVMFYDVLVGKMPEGRFELPSKARPDLEYNWDSMILSCMNPDPRKRPQKLELAVRAMTKRDKGRDLSTPAADCPEGGLTLKLKPTEIARPTFEPDPGAIFHSENVVVKYHPQITETKSVDPLSMEMVIIPGGEFYRGSRQGARDESPRHQVYLEPFALDVHPVTNEQFVRFLEVMGGEKDANNSDIIRLRESRIKRSGGRLSIESGYGKHPVVGVTWYGAVAYAKWVGKRLPTEAEWEVASYGGLDDSIYPSGTEIDRTKANFFSSDTTSVMSYPSNLYGLYDMAGNVYEWCEDWYDFHYYDVSVQEPNNPQGPPQGVYRVLRGGCWKSLKEDLRCSHRHRNNPGTMNGTYGFRCAADVSSQ